MTAKQAATSTTKPVYTPPHAVQVGKVTELTGEKGNSYADTGSGMAKGGSDD